MSYDLREGEDKQERDYDAIIDKFICSHSYGDISMKKSFLCKIGFHKWTKPRHISHGFRSRVLDVEKTCVLCGKKKTWVKGK